MDDSRSKPLVILAAVAATAAVISAIAWASGAFTGDGAAPASDRPTPSADPGAAPDGSTRSAEAAFDVAVYFVGDTPHGPRLFRELQQATGPDPRLAAIRAALRATPADPDYENPWPAGAGVDSVSPDGSGDDGAIAVRLTGDVPRARPTGMPPVLAELAVQQLVHTAQEAFESDAAIRLYQDGEPVTRVLGVDVREPLAAGELHQVQALVQLAEPAEGIEAGGTLQVSGRASSFEAHVPWQIRSGRDVVLDGFFTAEGWLDGLYPFSGTVDLAELEPGSYTFVALTDDPTGGTEGPGPTTDTRNFVIK